MFRTVALLAAGLLIATAASALRPASGGDVAVLAAGLMLAGAASSLRPVKIGEVATLAPGPGGAAAASSLRPARGRLPTVLAAGLMFAGAAQPADHAAARERFESADYEGAIELLAGAVESEALALLGRSHYGAGNFKQAIEALERATEAAPDNADYWDWLGRAYGRQAETGSMLRAFGWAKKCRVAFERSVELDGDNAQALADLFEYYIGAPGIIGGSVEKAAAISERLRGLDPVKHELTQASLAKKRKDWPAAERHLRSAVELQPDRADPLLSLARFLSDRDRLDESDRLFAEAAAAFPNAPKVLYEQAAAYIKADRKTSEARSLLERYLEADLTHEDPTPWEARRLLKRLD